MPDAPEEKPKPLGDRLKEATGEAHRFAETRRLQQLLVQGKLPASALGSYLGQLLLVHRRLEELLDAHPDVADVVGWSDDVRHSERLSRDLGRFGADGRPPAPLEETRLFLETLGASAARTPESLIGGFYVLEGSMNGNRFIVRALRQALAGRSDVGFEYFDPYGDEQPARWAAVKERLNRFAPSDEVRDSIIESALRMFDGVARISDGVAESDSTPEITPADASPAAN